MSSYIHDGHLILEQVNLIFLSYISYLDALENCLKHNRVLSDAPPVWTKPLEAYLDNAFKVSFRVLTCWTFKMFISLLSILQKERDEFKMSIVQEIKEDKGNHFRLYCEKILMDL